MNTTLVQWEKAAARRNANPIAVLALSLQQLADLLAITSDAQYNRKPVGVIPSSLGGHVRHCLDHFEALCTGAITGVVDYDDRQRGTAVETDRIAAMSAIQRLRLQIEALDESVLASTVRVPSIIAGDGTSIETRSSLGRELAFVVSHTVHHNALVAAMCRTLGISIPDRFGYAPATIAHLNESECALSPSSR